MSRTHNLYKISLLNTNEKDGGKTKNILNWILWILGFIAVAILAYGIIQNFTG